MREIPVDRHLFDALVQSGSTQVLGPELWLPHVQRMPDVLHVYGWSNTSTQAAQRVIRLGIEAGREFKQDEWLLVERRDGTVTMRGPTKDVDGGHHTDVIPPWPLRERPE